MTIGIDLMGGDTPPERLFEAVAEAVRLYESQHKFVVLATPEVVDRVKGSQANIKYVATKEVIAMDDEPLSAVRHKKGSSLVTGVRLLKKRHIAAFVTAGNTGALIAAAKLSLPLKPGIKRPALLANLPTAKGFVAVIDVGGNISCKAHHLVQFAEEGARFQRALRGIERPRVGLLNIGAESQKGTLEVRQAYQILKELGPTSRMAFVGNIEAREVMQGEVDVLVTDGFSGNVLLKAIEGTSTFILHFLANQFPQKPEWLKELNAHFNTEEYPGAVLCGVDGVVIKCHGNSTPRAFFQGIQGALKLIG